MQVAAEHATHHVPDGAAEHTEEHAAGCDSDIFAVHAAEHHKEHTCNMLWNYLRTMLQNILRKNVAEQSV